MFSLFNNISAGRTHPIDLSLMWNEDYHIDLNDTESALFLNCSSEVNELVSNNDTMYCYIKAIEYTQAYSKCYCCIYNVVYQQYDCHFRCILNFTQLLDINGVKPIDSGKHFVILTFFYFVKTCDLSSIPISDSLAVCCM